MIKLKKNHLEGVWRGLNPLMVVEVILLRGGYLRSFGRTFSSIYKDFDTLEIGLGDSDISNGKIQNSSIWLSIEETLFLFYFYYYYYIILMLDIYHRKVI
jgi:hypothetical protein